MREWKFDKPTQVKRLIEGGGVGEGTFSSGLFDLDCYFALPFACVLAVLTIFVQKEMDPSSLLNTLRIVFPTDLAKLIIGFVGPWPLFQSPEPVVQLLATQTTGLLVTTHPGKQIRFHSIETGELTDVWSLPDSGASRHVCLDPLDRYLYINRVNGDIAQYDLTTKTLCQLFKVPRPKFYSKKLNQNRLSANLFPIYSNVKLSEDGKILITATSDLECSVVLFNTETGHIITQFRGFYLIRSVTLCNHFVSIAYQVPETTLWDYTGSFIITYEESGVSCYVPRLQCLVVSKPTGLFVNDMSDTNEARFSMKLHHLMPHIDCFQLSADQTQILGSHRTKPFVVRWMISGNRFLEPRVVAIFSHAVREFVTHKDQVFALVGNQVECAVMNKWNTR